MSEGKMGSKREVSKGEIIFREGEYGDEIYLLKKGRVKIYREINGDEKVLAVLEGGSVFGEMAVIENDTRSASAQAIVKSELIIVDRSALLDKIKENSFIRYLISSLISRLKKVNEMWVFSGVIDDRIRVLKYLKYRALKNEPDKETDIDTGVLDDTGELSIILSVKEKFLKEFLEELKNKELIEIKDSIIIKSLEKIEKYREEIEMNEEIEEMKKLQEMSDISELFMG